MNVGMGRTIRRASRLASGVLIAVALVAIPTSARADHPPITCQDHDYGTDGVEKTGTTAAEAPQYRHYGLRGDVVVSNLEHCNRVSSLAVFSDLNSAGDGVFVEFGWVLGWANCNDTWSASPRLFVWWSNNGDGNVRHCQMLPKDPGASNVSHSMRLADVQPDQEWNAYYDGDLLENSVINTNWSSGAAVVNSERSNDQDSAYADFSNMEEYIDQWSAFDNIRLSDPLDPGYQFVRVAHDHGQVLAR
jgi:hypothetical protein